ncbi:MAG: hypothetical protein ACUVUC_06155 [Thermoguttaceae bacterium]
MGTFGKRDPARRLLPAIVLAAGLLLAGRGPKPACAGPLDKLDTSIQWLPADAAMYSCSLRLGEQVQIVAKSRAWASLKALPAVQKALQALDKAMEAKGPGQMLKTFWENPEVKKTLSLLGDMFSQEVFVYADPAVIDLLELLQQVGNAQNFGQMAALATGQFAPQEVARTQFELMLATLAERIELLKVPNIIVGFRVKDRQLAEEQLNKLEGFVNLAALALPQIAARIKRQKAGDGQYLTLTLDGGMIPWELVPLDSLREFETSPGDVEKIVTRVKQLKKVIAVGLRKDYVLLAVGPSMEGLARLGQGPALVDLPEMKRLEKFAGERICSIEFTSKGLAERMGTTAGDIDRFVQIVENILDQTDLPADRKQRIRKDAHELAGDLKRLVPKIGAKLAVDYLTDRGIEGYSYTWGEHAPQASAQPLGLLSHLGGRPILAMVGRGRLAVEDYDLLVKWLKKPHEYFEQFALPQMGFEERQQYNRAVEALRPLVSRFHAATRTKLIPALADGQFALVVDARLTSRRFHEQWPETEKPMPMAEPAVVAGVSNADLLRQAAAEYRQLLHATFEVIGKLAPEEPGISGIRIPEPEQTKTAAGTIWFYRAPRHWGLDPQIVLSLGLSDKVAVISASNQHTQRLLTATPLEAGGVLSDPDRPRAGAIVFDWAGLVDAATPWIELGVTELVKNEPAVAEFFGAGAPAAEQPAKSPLPAVLDQVRTVLGALKTLRTITLESYVEEGLLINHTLLEIRDIDVPAGAK